MGIFVVIIVIAAFWWHKKSRMQPMSTEITSEADMRLGTIKAGQGTKKYEKMGDGQGVEDDDAFSLDTEIKGL